MGEGLEFHVQSADAALEKCRELVRTGLADLFRGQTRDWPKLIPSLLRSDGASRDEAVEELEYFKQWARFVPQMAAYGGDETSIVAIAQHYGIPTSFLDLTTAPEVAALFAKSSGEGEPPEESVIYCFLRSDLETLSDGSLTSIQVSNLWRLEAQSGLFLHYLDDALAETLRARAIRIYFPGARLSPEDQVRLYPVRKSALEVAIDQWFYRREIERITASITEAKIKVLTRRQTYPGAFRWRLKPELQASWIGYEKAWVFPPVESVSIVGATAMVAIPRTDLSDPKRALDTVAEAIRGSIREHRATGKLISFSAQLSDEKASLTGSVSTLINRCWDGLRVLPYEADELVMSIALTAAFLVARAEEVQGVDDWSEQLFGELTTLEVAPIGGHIEAGRVSRADLLKAFSGEHTDKLTAYMRRRAETDPEYLMLYIVDHWMIFYFHKFRKIFAEQFVPSMMDMFWKEDLANNGGALGGLWSVNFNPALLGYVTPAAFRFYSPIAMAKACERMIYIAPDMERSDLEELFVSCMPTIEGGGEPFQVAFNDYSMDSREIWEIDRVIEQCRWIVEVGGISVLDMFPGLLPASCEGQGRPAQGLGAYEIWLIAEGKLHEVNGKGIARPLYTTFLDELRISNANVATRARAARDWPGPIREKK